MADFNSFEISRAVNDVVNGTTTWVIIGYEGNPSNVAVVKATGDGDPFSAIKSHLPEDECCYAYFRANPDERSRPKFALITWVGSKVPPLRAKASIHRVHVKNAVRECAAHFHPQSLAEISKERMMPAINKPEVPDVHQENLENATVCVLHRMNANVNVDRLILVDGQHCARDFASAERLLTNIRGIMEDHVNWDILRDVYERTEGVSFLQNICDKYSLFNTLCSNVIHNLLFYTQRYDTLTSIRDSCGPMFTRCVLRDQRVQPRLTEELISMTEHARYDDSNIKTAQSLCSALLKLSGGNRDLYRELFERPYLDSCDHFISDFTTQHLSSDEFFDCLRAFDDFITNEEKRAKQYDVMTAKVVHDFTLERVISQHINDILGMKKGPPFLLDALLNKPPVPKKNDTVIVDEEFTQLSLLYKLFKQVSDGIPRLEQEFERYVGDRCHNAVKSLLGGDADGGKLSESGGADPVESNEDIKREQGISVIDMLMKIKRMAEEVTVISFENNDDFKKGMNKQLGETLNDESIPLARFLSLYIDELVTNPKPGMQESQIDLAIQNIVDLFTLLSGKDAFEMYYIQHLTKRFLATLKENLDTEERLLDKLRGFCSGDFSNKVSKLIAGFSQGIAVNKDYSNWIADRGLKPFDFSVVVIPTIPIDMNFYLYEVPELHLPPYISEACGYYSTFYKEKFGTDRRKGHIIIVSNYGTAMIKSRFGGVTYTLETTTIQMLILNMFNKKPSISYSEICKNLPVTGKDLIKDALGFLHARNVLKLQKADKSKKGLSPSDMLAINPAFKSNKLVVKCYKTRETDKTVSKDEAKEELDKARGFELQAQIVRVMKSRQTLNHNNLFIEVFANVCKRFHPTPEQFKAELGRLMLSGIIERDESIHDLYKYIA